MNQSDKEEYVKGLISLGGYFLNYCDKGYDMIFHNTKKDILKIRKDVLRDFCHCENDIERYINEEINKIISTEFFKDQFAGDH